MSTSLSVIIPARNELKNLLWTLQALFDRLPPDGEVIVVLNQCDQADHDRLAKIPYGNLRVIRYDERPSCWQARNAGAAAATGEYLVFLDSHSMFRGDSLAASLTYHRGWRGILSYANLYFLDDPRRALYQYKWQPEKFWGAWTRVVPEPPDYRVLMSGMQLMIDRDLFEQVGGFHPALGIYGGGEPYLWLKSQMYGGEARCFPEYMVWHIAERRGYAWTNDDLWRNFMVAAWALGGAKYLDPVYTNYRGRCNGVPAYLTRLDELRDEAVRLADPDRIQTAAEASLSLDTIIGRWV